MIMSKADLQEIYSVLFFKYLPKDLQYISETSNFKIFRMVPYTYYAKTSVGYFVDEHQNNLGTTLKSHLHNFNINNELLLPTEWEFIPDTNNFKLKLDKGD